MDDPIPYHDRDDHAMDVDEPYIYLEKGAVNYREPCAIMSKTLVPSPFVKYVLPAQLRHRNANDVAFISEHAVHLKGTLADGSLCHLASKSDFEGRILAARVFGSPQKAHEAAHHGNSAADEETDILPPESVVLALDTGALMILWAQQDSTGRVSFNYRTVPLSTGLSSSDRPGQFLAVDPRYRVIAVAGHEGHLILYKTRDMDTWRKELHRNENATLIEDEKVFPLEGRVMHMEFLNSSASEDHSHIILVIVIAHHGRTKITSFDWDTKHGFDPHLSARALRVNLDQEDSEPSLLIPLSRSPDFLLVYDQHISTYVNILSGTSKPQHRTEMPPEVIPPVSPGDSTIPPGWTQWARVSRNPGFPKEVFYIAREDGKVIYAEIGPSKLPEMSVAGKLPRPVDTAFACVNVGSHNQPDVFVASGVASDGCIASIGSWGLEGLNSPYAANSTFTTLGSLPNWTSITDLAKGPERQLDRDSIFISSGRDPHGTIAEIRKGVEAPMASFALAGMKGCTGLWVIDGGSTGTHDRDHPSPQSYVMLLVCLFGQNYLLRLRCSNGVWDMVDLDDNAKQYQDVVSNEETISASMLPGQLAVHVSREWVRTVRCPTLEILDHLIFDGPVIAAASSSHAAHIAVAYRQHNQIILQTVEIQDNGSFGLKRQVDLPEEPTCIELLKTKETLLILVGTRDSFIRLYTISDSALDLVSQYNLSQERGRSSFCFCESAVLCQVGDEYVIVCGTRDGILVSLDMRTSASGLTLRRRDDRVMGSTPVAVTRSEVDPSVAFVSCGEDFCLVHHERRNHEGAYIQSIWLTAPLDDQFKQEEVLHVAQPCLATLNKSTDPSTANMFFAISGEKLLLARLDAGAIPGHLATSWSTQCIPRRWKTGATPMRLLYVEYLKGFIVATTKPVEVQSPPSGYRRIESALQLVKPTDMDIKQELGSTPEAKSSTVVCEFFLKDYERVYTMLEWVINDSKGVPHHFIYVGTGIMKAKGKEIGRKLILQVVGTTFMLKKRYAYRSPVRAMALLNPTHLLTIIGSDLVIEQYQQSTNKWKELSKIQLPSDGISVSVDPTYRRNTDSATATSFENDPSSETYQPCIFVSTATHSHLCYSLEKTTIHDSTYLAPEKWSTDTRLRSLTRHLVHNNIALIADKSCTLTGLSPPPERPGTHISDTVRRAGLPYLYPSYLRYPPDMRTFFEAHLPRSITRLQAGKFRVPWRRERGVEEAKQEVIGSCSDGTIYHLSLLPERIFIVLKLIQNVIEAVQSRIRRSTTMTPRTESLAQGNINEPLATMLVDDDDDIDNDSSRSDTVVQFYDVEVLEYGQNVPPKKRHVDADVIQRYLDGDMEGIPWDERGALYALFFSDVVNSFVWEELRRVYKRVCNGRGGGSSAGQGEVEGRGGEADRVFAREVQVFVRGMLEDLL